VYAVVAAWGLKAPKIWFSELGYGKPIEVGDEIVRIPRDTWEQSHENIRFGFQIVFGGPETVMGEPVLEMLNKMADAVTVTVGRFEEFLF
jgi:hypothetical protein